MSTQYAVTSTTRNLVLGAAALLAVGTGVGTVAAGDDSRITGAIQSSVLTTNGDLLARTAGVPARLGVGANGYVLTVSAGAPAWAPASTGGTYGSGTLAARPASPAAGDTYAVTSGAALGDRYACFVAGAWTLVDYSRVRLDETPYHWWRLNDASGGAVDSGSAGTDLAEVGSSGLLYAAPTPVGDGVQLSGSSGSRYFRAAVGAGVALTTAATLSAWVQSSTTTGTHAICTLETNQGSNSPPYASLAMSVVNGTLRGWVTTTNASGAGQVTSAGLLSPGCWHHVGVTFGASTLTLWVDGVAVATLGTSGSTIWTAGSSERWTIGDMTGPGERLSGRVADVRVEQTAKASSWWRETYARGAGTYAGQ